MRKFVIYFLSAACLMFAIQDMLAQDDLSVILEDELQREWKVLSQLEDAPYYMSYRVDEEYSNRISANLGNIETAGSNHERILSTSVRVGTPELDNFHEIRGGYSRIYSSGQNIPLSNDKTAICQVIWNETDKAYKEGIKRFAKVKANIAVKVESEDKAPDFVAGTKDIYYEEPIPENQRFIDEAAWKEKLKEYSKIFLSSPNIHNGRASISHYVIRKYFVDSEGDNIAHNFIYSRIMLSAEIKAEDGMVLPLYKSFLAYEVGDLPNDETIRKAVHDLVSKLEELRVAPVVEPYSGPAIMSGAAAGVFFHEIFGHRVEGQRQKSESDGQTFKKKINEVVLPEAMSVVFDPTLRKIHEQDLYGYYIYDDQGVKSEKVTVVDNGILKDFLMSRTPINNFNKSNGHGRAYKGRSPVARQSNLIVETTTRYSEADLRKMLIEEAKNQDKEFAYLFKNVTGGFTTTGRYMPNAFNVNPTEVYKIYVDGKADELVRGVDLVGTPLTMFSEVEAGGGKSEIFTGNCGAESGWVPVTAISPSLFVKQIELQKKSKSQEKPVILKRPDLQ